MKNFIQEFKTFAIKGNVLDLAIGVIIGASFGKITTSLVNDIINPILGLVIGKIDFSKLFIALNGKAYESIEAAKAAGAPVITFGVFLNTIIDFILVAFAVFLIVRQVNRIRRKEEATGKTEEPSTKKCPYCISTIPVEATKCPNCTSDLK